MLSVANKPCILSYIKLIVIMLGVFILSVMVLLISTRNFRP
jgi:hypothetical protein